MQNAADLPAFAASEVDGAAVLDALGWLGSGNAQELAYVLRQAAANSLGADELLRMLESMGHLDVVRGDDMTILNWGMARPTLAQTRQGQWSVIGTWGAEKLRQLRLANDEASLPRIISSSEDFLPVRLLTAQQTDLAPIAARLGVRLLPAAGLSLLRTLRPLGEIGRSLPRVKVDGFFEGERFDLSVGRWVPCSTISAAVGAYRVSRGFTRQYLFRNSTDLINGTASIATPQLAKHLAAQALGKPLMAYSPASQELFVPLGSEVPGLYGRALTQLSGRPAVRVQGSPSLVYRSVGQGEADHVAALLMN